VLDRTRLEISVPAGIYEVKFGPASWKGIEVRPGQTTTIAPGELRIQPTTGVQVVDSETGETFGRFDAVSPGLTVMPGVYDLRFSKTEWRFIKVDGGKRTTLNLVEVKLDGAVKWQRQARVVTTEDKEVFRFDAVTKRAVLPPGDYVVEIDDRKIPFAAVEGEVLEIKPQ
jgi:hypothetical protein